MATKVKGTRRSINPSEMERLNRLDQELLEQGYIVLDSQWMKNPKLQQFFAPIFKAQESSPIGVIQESSPSLIGVIRVDLKNANFTIMMPTNESEGICIHF